MGEDEECEKKERMAAVERRLVAKVLCVLLVNVVWSNSGATSDGERSNGKTAASSSVLFAAAFTWHDCLDAPQASSWFSSYFNSTMTVAASRSVGSPCDEKLGCLHFLNVTSYPDPVVRNGASQTVTKRASWTGKEDISEGLQVHFAQVKMKLRWSRQISNRKKSFSLFRKSSQMN